MMGPFHFLRPAWLLLIPVAVWIWWRMCHRRDPLRGWRLVMEPVLLKAMTVGDGKQTWRREWMLLVVWLLALVALAGPTWRLAPSPFGDDPVPLMVVLSATETMENTDLAPSRMERAQLKVAALAELRKGQPLGLIAFAGSSHLVMPPTRDTSIVAQMAQEISPSVMPKPGNDLAAAFQQAEGLLAGEGGTLVALVDDVPPQAVTQVNELALRLPVLLLAMAAPDSSEAQAIAAAGRQIGARVVSLTPDRGDLQAIVQAAARRPLAVAADSGQARWADDGWWLIPPIALLALNCFRRERLEEPSRAP